MKQFSLNKSIKTKILSALIFTFLFCFSVNLSASHYRGGVISWRKINSSTNEVEFTVVQSWRMSFYSGVSVGNTINTGLTFNFGDGSWTSINIKVTSVNNSEDWFTGEQKITHTYSSSGNYTAGYSNCCRVSNLQNGADANFSVYTTVNIGSTNNAPTSSMPAIINLQKGLSSADFTVPATDLDNDHLKWTLASYSDIQINNPSQLTIDTFGNAHFNTTGLNTGDLFGCAVKISDGKTYIIVDFAVKIVNNSTPPAFDYAVTPTNGYTYNVGYGNTISFTVKASDADGGDVVTLAGSGIPSGSTWSPGSAANPVSTSFSWTPSISDIGSKVIVFTAQDNNAVQTQTSVTINVLSCVDTTITSITSTPNNNTYTGGLSTNLYIGYPNNSPSTTLSAVGSSKVTWSPSTNLSCSTCVSPVFTPTTPGNYTLTATNCKGSKTINICVKDIRVPGTSGTGQKVYMFHEDNLFPAYGKSEVQAVLLRGISSHLAQHKKDKLGNGSYCATAKRDFSYTDVVIDEQYLEVMCTPNPFRNSFKLNYVSNSDLEATVSIYGMTGNLMETTHISGFSNEANLGADLPNGIYTVSFNQGYNRKVFRMIKLD